MKKGYNQNKCVEYKNKNKKKKISWEVRFASTLLIQTIITSLDFKLYQIKIQIVFLNGELNKKIYINQLTCFMATK